MGTPAPTKLTLVTTGTEGPRTAPAEPVPVAILARTSTVALQDPVASLSRQIRSCQAWLPHGWHVAGYYWDIESGALDLEARSQGQAWQPFAAAGIPRDGGMADLLTEASAPSPDSPPSSAKTSSAAPATPLTRSSWKRNYPARESRYSPPTSPPASKAPTPPPSLSAASSKA